MALNGKAHQPCCGSIWFWGIFEAETLNPKPLNEAENP